MSLRSIILDAATAVAVVCAAVTTFVLVRQNNSRNVEPDHSPVAVPQWEDYIANGRMLGGTRAPATIIEFADFQCPACRDLHRTFNRLQKENPGAFSISFHYAPLSYHPLAYQAARAAECAADQGKFQSYHDALFARFDSLSISSFLAIAKDVDMPNIVRFRECSSSTTPVARIEQDSRLAFKALKIPGTPTTIISGKMYTFVPTESELIEVLKLKKSSPIRR